MGFRWVSSGFQIGVSQLQIGFKHIADKSRADSGQGSGRLEGGFQVDFRQVSGSMFATLFRIT